MFRHAPGVPLLLALLMPAIEARAQDLSLQVNFIAGEAPRGEPVEVAFVVSNPTNEAVSAYRVSFFASRDATLDEGDPFLGAFASRERLRDNAFQENRLALDTCPLGLGDWRLFGRIEDVEPGDSDPGNDTALASATLTVVRNEAEPTTCPGRAPAPHINPGLNDAWFDPETAGQGLFVNVLGDGGLVFLGWFTYDAQRPPERAEAVLGDPGHRWLTALGVFEGDTAVLEVTNTRGGRFDRERPAPTNAPYGTLTLTFDDCATGRVVYDLPGPGLAGTIPLQRVAPDNQALCEALTAPNAGEQ